MAWGENKVEYQREAFCLAILAGKLNMSEACRQFQISRPTGYLWLDRYQQEGPLGLVNLSSKRTRQPHKPGKGRFNYFFEIRISFFWS